MDADSLRPHRDALRALLALDTRDPFPTFLRVWGLTMAPLAAALGLLAAWPHSAGLWVLTGITAGFVQNGLGLLMHEGSHYFFHRQKASSDAWCNALVCFPIFNTVQGYRAQHFDHHRRAGDPNDPYFALYAVYPSRWHLFGWFVLDATGISAVRTFLRRYTSGTSVATSSNPLRALLALAVVQLSMAALLWVITGRWYAWLVLWVAPLMTLTVVLNRFRTIVEHRPHTGHVRANRTSIEGWFEHVLVAPYGYNHHLEHHLLPQVPYYQLAAVHQFLAERMTFTPDDLAPDGYVRTFVQLVREMGRPDSPSGPGLPR